MSALQTGTLSVEDCDFTLGTDSGDYEELVHDIRKILDNLRDEKEQLQKQQAGLKATLVALTTLVKNGLACKKCKIYENIPDPDANKIINRDQNQLNDFSAVRQPPIDSEDNRSSRGIEVEIFEEDRICPLCSQFFHRSTKFEDFHTHVLTHFSDEEGDFESFITNNCEVVN